MNRCTDLKKYIQLWNLVPVEHLNMKLHTNEFDQLQLICMFFERFSLSLGRFKMYCIIRTTWDWLSHVLYIREVYILNCACMHVSYIGRVCMSTIYTYILTPEVPLAVCCMYVYILYRYISCMRSAVHACCSLC